MNFFLILVALHFCFIVKYRKCCDPLQEKGVLEKEVLEKDFDMYLKVTFREEIK